MRSLLISLILSSLFAACGGSNSSSSGGGNQPTFNHITPPAGARVVSNDEMKQIFRGTMSNQFLRGMYIEMSGTRAVNSKSTPGNEDNQNDIRDLLNSTCTPTVKLKRIFLGIHGIQLYVYQEKTTTGRDHTYDTDDGAVLACDTTTVKTETSIRTSVTPNNVSQLLAALFSQEPNDQVTFYDLGSKYAAYFTSTTDYKYDDGDTSTLQIDGLLNFQNPKTAPLFMGLTDSHDFYSSDFTSPDQSHLIDQIDLNLTTTASGIIPDLSALQKTLTNVPLCDGFIDTDFCTDGSDISQYDFH